VRIAYADPPYPGHARYYRDDPNWGEVNHADLIARLQTFDGWALSTYSNALHNLLPLCPRSARIGAWVKPFASFKPGINPGYAWEPVIFTPARSGARDRPTVRDWVAENITIRKGLAGAKPRAFCLWLFDLLGAERTDEFHDLFPGSGAVSAAWHEFTGSHPPSDAPLFAGQSQPEVSEVSSGG
jgi:hypothetical protein